MDYSVYVFSPREKVLYATQGAAVLIAAGLLFYRSIISSLLLSPLLLIFFRKKKEELIRKRRYELMLEFKEAIASVQSALNAGYSVENSFLEAGRDMEERFGKEGLITKEFAVLKLRLRANVTLEEILLDLAGRSGIEDIRDFADVFQAAKRSGGDLSRIIRDCVNMISGKVEVRREIETLISSKKMETRIMEAVPFGMIIYISLTSPEFITPLYHNVIGAVVMTACLGFYAGGFLLAEKVVQIEV